MLRLTLTLAVVFSSYDFQLVAAAEDAENPALASAKAFIRAIQSEDAAAAAKLCGVPWLDVLEERVVKDEAELKKLLAERLKSINPKQLVAEEWHVTPIADLDKEFPDIDDERFRKAAQRVLKNFKQVLGEDGTIVAFMPADGFGGWFVLVALADGKHRIVGGPYGLGYLSTGNVVPAAVREALAGAKSLELYSLDPSHQEEVPKDNFHDWKILGKTSIEDAGQRKQLVSALQNGVAESFGAAAACFNPRHGIRALHEGKTVDLVICFECFQVQIYVGDEQDSVLLTDSPQSVFDKLLSDAGVPLAKPAEE